MKENSDPGGGLRERKRLETAARIREAGIRLFAQRGYDATTLDEIADEAGISRRTFFHYFKSKDDILLSLQASADNDFAPVMRQVPMDRRPLEAARDALCVLASRYKPDELRVVDKLMRASEAVQARKQTFYIEREKSMLAALRERWPEPEREPALKLVAMVSLATFRAALDRFHLEDGARPLEDVLREVFKELGQETLGG
ncbi:TetR/AcrR family transcriptional regulator [Hyphomonas sp.]|uniref:TetR/AcrR family transcriptional regulator n=1 Tax=Hyphomonas sp. TaxID=87 RepID=UPI0039190837